MDITAEDAKAEGMTAVDMTAEDAKAEGMTAVDMTAEDAKAEDAGASPAPARSDGAKGLSPDQTRGAEEGKDPFGGEKICRYGENNRRTIELVGEEAFQKLQNSLVVVAGLGGVGGHCAEALARSGVGRLCLIDCDSVAESNLNRQLFAQRDNLGMAKTEAAAARLRLVSQAELSLKQVCVTAETAASCIPEDADFVVDAIDSVQGKLALILLCREKGVPIVSSMGAGCRVDPTAFRVTDIYRTKNDPLARRMRQELRRAGIDSLPVVASEELPKPRRAGQPLGSIAPATGAAGLALAGYVLRRLLCGEGEARPGRGR